MTAPNSPSQYRQQDDLWPGDLWPGDRTSPQLSSHQCVCATECNIHRISLLDLSDRLRQLELNLRTLTERQRREDESGAGSASVDNSINVRTNGGANALFAPATQVATERFVIRNDDNGAPKCLICENGKLRHEHHKEHLEKTEHAYKLLAENLFCHMKCVLRRPAKAVSVGVPTIDIAKLDVEFRSCVIASKKDQHKVCKVCGGLVDPALLAAFEARFESTPRAKKRARAADDVSKGDRTVAIPLSEFSRQQEMPNRYAPGVYYLASVFDKLGGTSSLVAQRALPVGVGGQITFMPLSVRIEHTVHFDLSTQVFGRTHLPLTESELMMFVVRVFDFEICEILAGNIDAFAYVPASYAANLEILQLALNTGELMLCAGRSDGWLVVKHRDDVTAPGCEQQVIPLDTPSCFRVDSLSRFSIHPELHLSSRRHTKLDRRDVDPIYKRLDLWPTADTCPDDYAPVRLSLYVVQRQPYRWCDVDVISSDDTDEEIDEHEENDSNDNQADREDLGSNEDDNENVDEDYDNAAAQWAEAVITKGAVERALRLCCVASDTAKLVALCEHDRVQILPLVVDTLLIEFSNAVTDDERRARLCRSCAAVIPLLFANGETKPLYALAVFALDGMLLINESLFSEALSGGRTDLVLALLQYYTKPHTAARAVLRLLVSACADGNEEVVIECLARIDTCFAMHTATPHDALTQASRVGNVNIVRRLLAAFSIADSVDSAMWISEAVRIAAKCGHLDVLDLLFAVVATQGVVLAPSSDGEPFEATVLGLAVLQAKHEPTAMRALELYGVSSAHLLLAVSSALVAGLSRVADELLQRLTTSGVVVSDEHWRTWFRLAVEFCDAAVLCRILDGGASAIDVCVTSNQYDGKLVGAMFAFCFASYRDHVDMLALLLPLVSKEKYSEALTTVLRIGVRASAGAMRFALDRLTLVPSDAGAFLTQNFCERVAVLLEYESARTQCDWNKAMHTCLMRFSGEPLAVIVDALDAAAMILERAGDRVSDVNVQSPWFHVLVWALRYRRPALFEATLRHSSFKPTVFATNVILLQLVYNNDIANLSRLLADDRVEVDFFARNSTVWTRPPDLRLDALVLGVEVAVELCRYDMLDVMLRDARFDPSGGRNLLLRMLCGLPHYIELKDKRMWMIGSFDIEGHNLCADSNAPQPVPVVRGPASADRVLTLIETVLRHERFRASAGDHALDDGSLTAVLGDVCGARMLPAYDKPPFITTQASMRRLCKPHLPSPATTLQLVRALLQGCAACRVQQLDTATVSDAHVLRLLDAHRNARS